MVIVYVMLALITGWASVFLRNILPEKWRTVCVIKVQEDPLFCLPLHWLIFMGSGFILGTIGLFRRNKLLVAAGYGMTGWQTTEWLIRLWKVKK